MIASRSNHVRLSFCTTCMGRKHHLEKTLPENLNCIQQFEAVEINLIDYSSPDGLEEWIHNNFSKSLQTGHLVYAKVMGCNYFQVAHAKNIAHRLASGKIVCNLDADNFVEPKFVSTLLSTFTARNRIFSWFGRHGGGFGRIAMRKYDFAALGGYDERMTFGWGFEDNDLVLRAIALGLKAVILDSNFATSIEHPNEERVRFCHIRDCNQSREIHKMMSETSRRSGQLVANLNQEWGWAPRLKVVCNNLHAPMNSVIKTNFT